MKIRRIAIRNFRKLRGPVVIDGLTDGLTVIAGDNEEGKSTILSAVQTAFFNRHRLSGEAANAMQPFGSQLRPEIGVDFEMNGEAYALRKAFCQNPEAELTGPGGRTSGDAVEERLQALLRFDPPGKGAAKPEHRGTWGLFWVEQGTAFARPQLGDSGRETLVSALEGEVGQVLGGERGRALIAAIAERNDAFFTRTGRPRGDYKEAQDRVPALAQECDGIRGRLREYEKKIDDLARLRARLRAYVDDRGLETAEAALRSATDAKTALDTLETARADAETGEKLAHAALTAAQTSWNSRDEKIKAIAKHVEHENACQETLTLKAEALATAEAQKKRLAADYEAARSAFKTAEAVLDAGERALQRARAKRELDELQGRFSGAAVAKAGLDTLRSQAEKIRIDAAAVQRLRRLEKAADEARLSLQSIATGLRFAPDGERNVARDGRAVPVDQPLFLTEEVRLTLEGFGDLTVTPGGKDLAPLRREAARAGEHLADALQRLGVADVAEAERLLTRRADLLAQAGALEATVNAHAPDGIEALRQRVGLKEAELAELSCGASPVVLAVESAEKARDDARRKRNDANTMLEQTESALKAAETSHSAIRDTWLNAQNDLNNAQSRLKDSQRALEEERARIGDADLRDGLRDKAEAHQRAATTLAACRAAVEKSNPEEVHLRLRMSEQALIRIKADIAETTTKAFGLEGELRGLGQAGLGEQLAEKEGELARARDHAARIEREARATRLLLESLQAAERQAKETFLGPVRERINPYLKLLFPDAEVLLGEDDLAISHLRREGVDEPFESLSVGTREQLAVLTRLAFAEFLRDKGRPAAVILDDALAYSDDARFDRMQVVLRKAAEKLQVIVLTCRERDYHGLGAPIIRLADCN